MRCLVRTLPAYLAVGLILAPSAAGAIEPTWPPDSTPRQINVTSDSVPGWLPTEEQIAGVRKTTDDFFAAKDDGRSADAYGLLTDLNRQDQPFQGFSDAIQKFNLLSGPVKEQRIVTVTWTKNPAAAPAPGVYAALDVVSLFANIDRYCGFLILYQSPAGGPFRVMREENNFLDNATAEKIEQQHSRADVDRAWAQLSAHCPNYTAELPPLPEQTGSSVGYPTVAAALQGLHANPSIEFSSQAGWTIANDKAGLTIWSFPPEGDPAYPAVVKREIVQDSAGVEMKMAVLCQSTKQACDNLVRQFEQLNAQMKAALKGK
jgi:hypothetical protein